MKFLAKARSCTQFGYGTGHFANWRWRFGRGALAAVLAATLGALLAACQVTPADQGGPGAAAESPDQHGRVEVLEAFVADPDAAARRYREVWDERSVSSTGDFTLLAIAQGMVQHHRGNPDEFLRFAAHKSRSKDANVVEAALWVYSGASDEQTLDALFGFLPDQRGTASMAAESVIAYRRAAARSDARRTQDGARIARRLEAWCADPKHHVRPLCLTQEAARTAP
jgi:hypothetical protein